MKTSTNEAQHSASVDYNSKNMNALRGARTATEFKKILGDVVDSVSNVNVPRNLMSLSAKAIELSDIKQTGVKKAQTKTLDLNSIIDISKIDLNNVREKAKYNRQVNQLSQAIAELNTAYTIMNSKMFSAFKDQNKAAQSMLNVIKEATDTRTNLVRVMSIDVKKDAPPEHTKLAGSIANYLKSILPSEQYSNIRIRTFIASAVDPIIFQTFVFVDNFVNSDGVHYQNYAVVLSTSVAVASGISANYVTTLFDEKVPGSFPLGRSVDTAAQMKKAINSLMAIDGFLNFAERKPIAKGTSTLRNSTMLGGGTVMVKGKPVEIFDSIRVQNDKLYVRLVQGLTKTERQIATEEILAQASTALRSGMSSKNSMIHRFVKGRGGREFIEIALTTSGGAAKGALTLAKIDQLAESLGLTNDQKRLLKQSVK